MTLEQREYLEWLAGAIGEGPASKATVAVRAALAEVQRLRSALIRISRLGPKTAHKAPDMAFKALGSKQP